MHEMSGEVFTHDELEAQTGDELGEANDLQGTNYSFADYPTESVHTGTIDVSEREKPGGRDRADV